MTTKASPNVINNTALFTNPTFTGTVTGVSATAVGLGNANNTSDVNKPVSTAQQTALDLKANIANPTFTGVPAAPTAAYGTSNTQLATTAFVQAVGLHSPGVNGVSTSTYTITSADYGRYLYVNYAGVCTITMPATTPPTGTIISISNINATGSVLVNFTTYFAYALGYSNTTSLILNTGEDLMICYTPSSWVEICGKKYGGFAHLADVKAVNVDGGGCTASTEQTRLLNTIVSNTIKDLSLNTGNGQFSLPAGTYKIHSICPAYMTGGSRARLINQTLGTSPINGSSALLSTVDGQGTYLVISGVFTITANNTFYIGHYTNNTHATNGLGFAANASNGGVEYYTQVFIEKII